MSKGVQKGRNDDDLGISRLGPNPPPQPTVTCPRCRQRRNVLSIYATEDGLRACFSCVREAPIAV
jgi:hypothetical protein